MKRILLALIAVTFFVFQNSSANADEAKIFVGKIEKAGPAFRYFWKFTAVADNGEKKEFCVPRDGTTIIQIDGKQRYGEAPRKGRKIEVKYSVTERGDNKTVAMRYVPLDYVQQPAVSSVAANAPSETTPPIQEITGQPGNTVTGKMGSFTRLMGKPPKWIYGRFTVVADSGESMVIYVLKATAVTGASGKNMTEGGEKLGAFFLKTDERIEVKYSTVKKGHNEAISIRCLD